METIITVVTHSHNGVFFARSLVWENHQGGQNAPRIWMLEFKSVAKSQFFFFFSSSSCAGRRGLMNGTRRKKHTKCFFLKMLI